MKRKIETYGSVKDGVVKISYRDRFMQQLKSWPNCRIRLVAEKIYRKRSTLTENGLGQNGYYFGIVCAEYVEGAWDIQHRQVTRLEAHEELKANCNYREHVNEDTGSVMKEILSTANLTTVEFEEYLDRCRAFILEWFGRDVPLPNEQGEMELK